MKGYSKKDYRFRVAETARQKGTPSVTISVTRYEALIKQEAFVESLRREMSAAMADGTNSIWVRASQFPE